MIKTITFDFGGVLYRYDGEKFLQLLASRSDKSPELLREKMSGSSLDRAHFKGEVGAEELLEILRGRIGLDMTKEELAEAYAEIVEPNEDMFALVRALKDDYNLQLYSDTPKLLYEHVMVNMPVFDLFSAKTLSFEVGELKDSPEGYREVIEKSGHAPGEIIFIDDREEVAAKAKELGINGIRFTDMENLVEQLENYGVKLDGKLEFTGGKA